jgi:hypothetical protein
MKQSIGMVIVSVVWLGMTMTATAADKAGKTGAKKDVKSMSQEEHIKLAMT